MKLFKIKEDHYIVTDESEVRPGDWVYTSVANKIVKFTDPRHFSDGTYWKITHSTRPFGGSATAISLFEVKQLIGEVDVEKKIYALCQTECIVDSYGKATDDGMVIGIRAYNQALEDNKDRKYTEEDLAEAILRTIDACNEAQKDSYGELEIDEEVIIQSLQPKTEWEVEIINDKLKLK